MFSTADENSSTSATDNTVLSTNAVENDQILENFTTEETAPSATVSVPVVTPKVTEPEPEQTIPPQDSTVTVQFTTPKRMEGLTVLPDIETPVVTPAATTTTAPVTTTKPVTTTTKPVTTTKAPATTKAPEVSTPTVESASLSKFLSVVIGEIGVKEKAYNNVKYNTWYYGRTVSASSNSSTDYAWCGVFISWCANQAGIPTSVIPVTASSDYYYSWFKSRGQYFKYSAGTPQPGDLIFIDWDKRHGSVDHVGIVISVDDGIVTTVEGNYSNKVSCNTYALDSGYIVGYGRPNYN